MCPACIFKSFCNEIQNTFFAFAEMGGQSVFIIVPCGKFVFGSSIFYIFLIELVHIFAVVVNVGIFKRIYSNFRIHPDIFFSQNVGLYGTVDEVDTEKKTVVLDVDGVYLTFELTAIKTVLPLTEGITAVAGADGSVDMSEDTAIEEE